MASFACVPAPRGEPRDAIPGRPIWPSTPYTVQHGATHRRRHNVVAHWVHAIGAPSGGRLVNKAIKCIND